MFFTKVINGSNFFLPPASVEFLRAVFSALPLYKFGSHRVYIGEQLPVKDKFLVS